MQYFNSEDLKQLYIPSSTSHKGQNGKLMIIGGSHLFHAASLWSLEVASRIVDMVFYSSVPENDKIVQDLKEQWRSGIVVPRNHIENYIEEAEVILIGPGMERTEAIERHKEYTSLEQINAIVDAGEQTYFLTKYLLEKYPEKKWVIDAGALQMLELSWLKHLHGNVVLTPHMREFERLFNLEPLSANACDMAEKHNCVIVLKRNIDTIACPTDCVLIEGGNAGMTKGGTGDVLAGLISALACKNDLYFAAKAASYINKKAGESLYEKVGMYFNASDLAQEIPSVMAKLLSVDKSYF